MRPQWGEVRQLRHLHFLHSLWQRRPRLERDVQFVHMISDVLCVMLRVTNVFGFGLKVYAYMIHAHVRCMCKCTCKLKPLV